MADCPSVCEHLHLPVQSGDDAVLRRMGRQYTIEHYLERLARSARRCPGIALSTDVIVGFCGETEAQFELDAPAARDRPLRPGLRGGVLASGPGRRRRGSPTMSPPDEKRRRLNELLALQEAIGLERNRAWVGRESRSSSTRSLPPRSHDHEAEPPTAESRDASRTCPRLARLPAAPARTSSSTSRATRPRRAARPRPDRPRRAVRAPGTPRA